MDGYYAGCSIFVGVIVAVFLAVNDSGMSLGEVLSVAGEHGLTKSFVFDFNLSGYNVWLALIAGFMCWISYFGFNQLIRNYV